MSQEETILLDTNILVYATFSEDPFFKKAKKLRDKAMKGEIKTCITPQILSEFYAVITDPKRVSNPLSPELAKKEAENYFKSPSILKIYMKKTTVRKMLELAEKYQIKSQQIFDVQLVATMLDNNIRTVYTVNQEDFKKFREIKTLNPLISQKGKRYKM